MAHNFYHILEASDTASQDTLRSLFEQKRSAFQQEQEDGSPTAKEQLWVLKQAYDTLSVPAKRAAYDQSLKKAKSEVPLPVAPVREGLSWKLNFLLIAVLASGLVGFGLQLGRANKKDDRAVQVLKIDRTADNEATRAGTERVLVDGVLKNDEKIIDRSAELGNRSLGIQESAESRHRQELEYRANATRQAQDLERERQMRQMALEEQRQKTQQQEADTRRVERERRYWACMNSELDRTSAATAGARCSGYR